MGECRRCEAATLVDNMSGQSAGELQKGRSRGLGFYTKQLALCTTLQERCNTLRLREGTRPRP